MKRILLYEQSKTFAQFMRYVLTGLSYEVFHVDNAGQALEAIKASMPDMIIADTTIEGMGGVELCKKLKAERMLSSIPVAIVSIDGTMEARLEAHAAGCVDYLTKPLTARSLHELTERHLPFHHKRHHIRATMYVNSEISDGERTENLKTLSIGEGGMYARTDNPFVVGTSLSISLPLPSLKSPLQLRGEVIYVANSDDGELPKGMGLKFIGMDSNTVTLLRHYMESYLSDYLTDPVPRG